MRGDTTFGEYKKLKLKGDRFTQTFWWSITKKDTKKDFLIDTSSRKNSEEEICLK